MAKDDREIAWVSFQFPARLSSQDSGAMAWARGETTRLFKRDIDGIPHVVAEDPSLAVPGNAPWSNVASVGWVKS
jgi:hypothetical protein